MSRLHAVKERAGTGQNGGGELQLADDGLQLGSRASCAAAAASSSSSRISSSRSGVHDMVRCDGVELDAEEGQPLSWPFGLVRVDDQAEARERVLRHEQRALRRLAALVREQRVVQVAVAAVDAPLAHGEGRHGQQLCADARRRAEAERHASELVQLPVEAEDEVGQRGRVKREGQEAVGQVELAEPAAGRGLLDCLSDGGVGEVLVHEVVVEVAGQVDDEPRLADRP